MPITDLGVNIFFVHRNIEHKPAATTSRRRPLSPAARWIRRRNRQRTA